jgi:hypothetical protein
MRLFFPCAVLVLASGCSVVPREAWTFDPTHPEPRAVLPVEEAAALTDRMAQLQLERNTVRTRIAAEPDVWVRQRLYQQLHGIGMELSPLERRLATVTAAR